MSRKFSYILGLISGSLLFAMSCGQIANPDPQGSADPDTTTTVQQPDPTSTTTTTPASTPQNLSTPPAWQEPQVALKELEEAFANKDQYLASYAQINARYKLEDTFSGKSGSHIYDVSLKSDPKERRVFKVVKEFSGGNLWDHIGFKEIYFSKMLSELGPTAFLPAGKSASMFFPKFYGFGFVGSENPFEDHNESSKKFYPYYVMENISGLSLQDFALKPELAQEKLGYRLDNAPKGVIFSILYQISLALLFAEQEFGFLHNDIHPKNIYLSTSPVNLTVNAFGTEITLTGPLVKIIDFDQGAIKGREPTMIRAGLNFSRHKGGQVGEEKAFFLAVDPKNSAFKWLALVPWLWGSPNIDMYMLNVLLYAFERHFLDNGVPLKNKRFKDLFAYTEFLRINAHKFGLAKP